MKNKFIYLMKTIEPEFERNDSSIYPLPVKVSIYLSNDSYLIDLSLDNGCLIITIFEGETEIKPTMPQVDLIWTYLEDLLTEEIELTKRYYEEQKYEE